MRIKSVVNGETYTMMPDQLDKCLVEYPYEEAFTVAKAALRNPAEYWVPNGAQEKYIKAAAHSIEDGCKIPVILVTAANGVGKTEATINILTNIVYGVQNGWFDYELYHNFPFPKVCWIISNRYNIDKNILPMIRRFFPPGRYKEDKQGKPFVSSIHVENGWEIVFFSSDQDKKEMEGATVGLFIMDEPQPQFIWKALKSRRRKGCLGLMPMTPLDVEPYILDELEKDRKKHGNFKHITASVFEACDGTGIRGHLDKTTMEQMIEEYDEDEKEARVYGRFMYFSERIYTLDQQRHYVEPDDYPVDVKRDVIVQVVDPKDGRDSAAIWMAFQKNGRIVVFAEQPEKKTTFYWKMKRENTIEQEIERWIRYEAEFMGKLDVYDRIIDRHFGTQTRGGKSFTQLIVDTADDVLKKFRETGEPNLLQRQYFFTNSYKSQTQETELTYGHNKVREKLRNLPDGKPGLVIWKTCQHTWWGLTHYVRKRATTMFESLRAQTETKIVEKYKDFPDCVRYGVCLNIDGNENQYEEEPGEQINKQPKYYEESSERSLVGNLYNRL